ncbi:cytochrome b [Ancylobacter sp. 6x-1]|uniref:Cytochrome b n=1 Tax=Ancylobacter crimeensis TaxID=2579147 RepID=A0ABT0D7A9_9HYPH|nr:cytochrome b [Ancylobacter crimeensis]MCK0195833.1 cytochrome b [Ancylobacter crimeensis]
MSDTLRDRSRAPRPARFSRLQRSLHWLMAVAVIAMLFIGVGMVSTVSPAYVPLLTTHRTLGIAILVLAVLRLAVRAARGTPPLPVDLPRPMKIAAKLSHVALYGLMIMMPLIGWAMVSSAGNPVLLLGGVQLPPILPANGAMHAALWKAHAALAFCFFALILLHLAAGLFHGLLRRDGVFESMAPVSSERRREAPVMSESATRSRRSDDSA